MNEDMSDLFANVKKMVDNGNIPEDLQKMVQNFSNQEGNKESSTEENSNTNTISPEMINMLSGFLQSNSSETKNSDSSSSPNMNIDMNTILKMKKVMDSMNQKDDPRSNLLYSLKPYLREKRKSKLDQYVGLLNMTKIADVMKNEKKENSDDA